MFSFISIVILDSFWNLANSYLIIFQGDVYLTAPNSDLGLAAVDELKKEGCHVLFHQLDINETNSIEGIRDE